MNSCVKHYCSIVIIVLASIFIASCQSTQSSSVPSYLNDYRVSEITFNYSQAEEPIHVAKLEKKIRQELSGGSILESAATRFGFANQTEARAALERGINSNIQPHVSDAMGAIFTGSKSARIEVLINSVFIRDRLHLQQLTGATVIVNGKRRPDNAQLIAGIRVYDQENNFPIQEVDLINKIDDGAVTLIGGGPEAPNYGPSKTLNKLAFQFAQTAASALQQNASSNDAIISGSDGDVKVLYSKTTRTEY